MDLDDLADDLREHLDDTDHRVAVRAVDLAAEAAIDRAGELERIHGVLVDAVDSWVRRRLQHAAAMNGSEALHERQAAGALVRLSSVVEHLRSDDPRLAALIAHYEHTQTDDWETYMSGPLVSERVVFGAGPQHLQDVALLLDAWVIATRAA